MVRQHDAARADAKGAGAAGDVSDDDGGRRAGDTRHVVVLGHPEAAVAPAFGMGGEVARVVERRARIAAFGDAGKLQDRQRGHGQSPKRSEEHTSELQSLMRNSYAVFCLKKKKREYTTKYDTNTYVTLINAKNTRTYTTRT